VVIVEKMLKKKDECFRCLSPFFRLIFLQQFTIPRVSAETVAKGHLMGRDIGSTQVIAAGTKLVAVTDMEGAHINGDDACHFVIGTVVYPQSQGFLQVKRAREVCHQWYPTGIGKQGSRFKLDVFIDIGDQRS